MTRSIILTGLICCILVFVLAACIDDDNPVCPDNESLEPTLANIWPHSDGNTWTFDVTYQEYHNPEEIIARLDTSNYDDIPSMHTLHTQLQESLPGSLSFAASGLYQLAFDGQVVTESGVTAQNVSQIYYLEMDNQNSPQICLAQETSDPLLQLIYQSRPDLRQTIGPLLNAEIKNIENLSPPMFLGGYAFAFEDTGYFGYGDLNENHSWIYLDSSLEVGTEFAIQLVPMITDDIWLYGRIWSKGSLVVNGNEFEKVVECMYLLDLGMQHLIDEEGNDIGDCHPYIYGTTHFAPGVGPVRGLERRMLPPNPSLQDNIPDVMDLTLDLVGLTRPE